MLAKELRDIRWRFMVGLLLFLAALTTGIGPYEDPSEDPSFAAPRVGPDGTILPVPEPPEPTEFMFLFHVNGEFPLALLAAVLGAGLISGEASRGTIFFLLSKPVDRARVLLIKYGVGALALLVAATLGGVSLVASESIHGYPVGSLDAAGVALSVVLMWLGALFVLGVAILCSVVFGDAVKSFLTTLLVGYLMFNVPVAAGDDGLNPLPQLLVLPDFWRASRLYSGESFAITNFLVCFTTAALPLMVALWLFRRRPY